MRVGEVDIELNCNTELQSVECLYREYINDKSLTTTTLTPWLQCEIELVKKLIALMFTRKEKTVYVVGYSFKWLGLFRLSLWPFLVNFGRRSLSVMF